MALLGLAAFAAAPVAYGAALATLAAVFAGAAAAAAAARLIDPVEIAAPALTGFAAAAAVMGVAARRRARFLRARFERHLAPQVIARIVANSDAPKLVAERREITALFTDIEGFTGMVGRSPPAAMVAALDGYFEGMTGIALAHGGLMDKFVGDACDVFFNMPFDLEAHATHALDCAEAMARWSEVYRREPGPAALGFRANPDRHRKRPGAGRRHRRRRQARLYRAWRDGGRRRAAGGGQQTDGLVDLRRSRRERAHRAGSAAAGRPGGIARLPRAGRRRLALAGRRVGGVAHTLSLGLRATRRRARPRRREFLRRLRRKSAIPWPRSLQTRDERRQAPAIDAAQRTPVLEKLSFAIHDLDNGRPP